MPRSRRWPAACSLPQGPTQRLEANSRLPGRFPQRSALTDVGNWRPDLERARAGPAEAHTVLARPPYLRLSIKRARSCSTNQPKMATNSGRTGPLLSSSPPRAEITGTPIRSTTRQKRGSRTSALGCQLEVRRRDQRAVPRDPVLVSAASGFCSAWESL